MLSQEMSRLILQESKRFNPIRLSIARKRRKLSVKKLAELTNLAPLTISRLEKSFTSPEESTVYVISVILDYPKEFFYGEDLDLLTQDAVSFRSLSAMTAKERDSALSAGSIAYLFSDWVSCKFNLPKSDLLNMEHTADPEYAARIIRQHWGLGEKPISYNLIALLESKGIRIFSLSEQTRNIDAFSCWRNDIPYIFLNTGKSAEHTRFDAAHELGHLILHRHGGPHSRDAEKEANRFASSFLMPSADICALIPFVDSLDTLVKVKQRWRVSVTALAYRLHELHILSDWQYRTLCIQIGKRGYRTNEPQGLLPEESPIWRFILEELWKERITRLHIAKELCIPLYEVNNLVSGLLQLVKSDTVRINSSQ